MTLQSSESARVFRRWPFALAASASLGSALAQPASFQGLGLPAPEAGDWAVALSGDGSTVVASITGAAGFSVYRWTSATGWTELHAPPPADGWWAGGVSADGSVIVGGVNGKIARWTAATGVVNQGGLGGFDQTFGAAVGGDGIRLVGTANDTLPQSMWCPCVCPPTFHFPLFEYTAISQAGPGGQIKRLFPVAGDGQSFAVGLSADGSVVVGQSRPAPTCGSGARQACLWLGEGSAVPLGVLPGATWSEAVAVSADGTAVVGSSADNWPMRAFRWTQAGGMIDLGTVPGASQAMGSIAVAVSGDGQIVAGRGQDVSGGGIVFLWDQSHGMRDLRAVLAGLGLNVEGWRLSYPVVYSTSGHVELSLDGRTLAGGGINPAGQPEVWRAFLGDAVCYPDCNGDSALTVADFGCFQTNFNAGDPSADCNADGSLTVADFGCFQTKFVAGCP